MARLPDRYALSGPESLRSGRQISSADTSAIGRGMASLGSSIQQAGNVMASIAAKEKQKDTALGIARANAYQDQANIELANSFSGDPDYATFGTRADEKAKQIASTAAEFIPDPDARELWKVQAGTTAKATTDSILDKGVVLKRQDDLVKLDEALDVQRRIYIDPNSSETQKAAARAKIEGTIEVAKGTGLLLPDEYSTRKKVFIEGADFDRAKLDTTLLDPREAYFAAIRSSESGGNDAAKNPNSSATGRYQFTEDTWNRLVTAYPTAGLTADGRTDPTQQERAIRLFTAENERTLAQAGLPATNGNLYAAHFLGAGGASTVLSAPDGAAVEGLVGAEVVKANPFLKGMTVADFKAWTNEKSGGAGAVLPDYVNRLSPEDRQTVFDMRASEQARATTAAAAQAKIEYSNLDGSIGLGILTGDIVSEQQILQSALDDADKAKHLRAFRAEADATTEARQYLSGLADGTAPALNPYNSDDRSLVDKAYTELTKVLPEDQRVAAGDQFVAETGMIPDAVVADVRLSLGSTNPTVVSEGLARAARLYDAAPQALASAPNGKDISDAAIKYDELVNGMGMNAAQAAQRVIDDRNPENVKRREVLKPLWAQAIKDNQFKLDDVRAAFDGAEAGVSPAQVQGINADYLAAAERAFMGPANGDVGIARRLATEEMKRTYGASSVSGRKVLMKFPPEKFFPVIGEDQSYIRDIALKDMRSIAPDATGLSLVATDETAQDVRSGQPPRYTMLYQRPDGVWDQAPDLFTVGKDDLSALSQIASEERRIKFEIENARQTYIDANVTNEAQAGLPSMETMVPDYAAKQAELDALAKQRREILGTVDPTETPAAAQSEVDAEAAWQQKQAETFGSMGVGSGAWEKAVAGTAENPFEDILKIGPPAMRVYLGTITGDKSEITEKAFTKGELDALSQAVARAEADGRNYLDYKDYDPSMDSTDASNGSVGDRLLADLGDMNKSLAGVFGRAKFVRKDNGDIDIEDTYDFGNMTGVVLQDGKVTPWPDTFKGDVVKMFTETYKEMGLYQAIRVLGENAASEEKGNGRKVRVTIKKRGD